MKWDFCSKAKGDKKYVICNADEGDSGAFSDRYLLEDQPLKVIFGMVLCGMVIGSDEGVLYIRGEYPKSIEAINGCINELKKLNLLGDNILGTDFSFDLRNLYWSRCLYLWRRNCFDCIYRRKTCRSRC
jgi:NADH:ubiquinone oxidoreductase subunit F (NADH-binding)